MIEVDGIKLYTEREWERRHRHVLKRQLDKGVKRTWKATPGNVSATWYREDQTRPWSGAELKREARRRAEARERERLERERRDAERRRWLDDVTACWGGVPDGVGQADVGPHTAFQWVAMGLVPIAEARWGHIGPAEDYYYCGPWDVRRDEARAMALMEGAPRTYDRLPDGRPYDGRPWW